MKFDVPATGRLPPAGGGRLREPGTRASLSMASTLGHQASGRWLEIPARILIGDACEFTHYDVLHTSTLSHLAPCRYCCAMWGGGGPPMKGEGTSAGTDPTQRQPKAPRSSRQRRRSAHPYAGRAFPLHEAMGQLKAEHKRPPADLQRERTDRPATADWPAIRIWNSISRRSS